MNNIIQMSVLHTQRRMDKMPLDTQANIIYDLRLRKGYWDMPSVAENLLALFSESNTYPVPVIGIAKKLGFKVYDLNMEEKGLSGFIAIDQKLKETFGSSQIIAVNTRDSSGHKRFTIAHELAHYLFDAIDEQEYYNTYVPDDSQWSEENPDLNDRERVANYFAANLLMPSLDFRRKFVELNSTGETSGKGNITSQLANHFGVPETAVKIRYKELGIK